MRFFTPELFVALNSDREETVDAALERWEAARDAYKKYYAELKTKLPKPFVKLCESVSLHDSRIERPAKPVSTLFQTDDEGEHVRAVISLNNEHAEFDLVYRDLVKPTEWSKPLDSDCFNSIEVLWLYDEAGQTKSGDFTHEILFSNGSIVLITFQRFSYVERPLISERQFSKAVV